MAKPKKKGGKADKQSKQRRATHLHSNIKSLYVDSLCAEFRSRVTFCCSKMAAKLKVVKTANEFSILSSEQTIGKK